MGILKFITQTSRLPCKALPALCHPLPCSNCYCAIMHNSCCYERERETTREGRRRYWTELYGSGWVDLSGGILKEGEEGKFWIQICLKESGILKEGEEGKLGIKKMSADLSKRRHVRISHCWLTVLTVRGLNENFKLLK